MAAKAKKEYSELKKRALLAKQRLKMGYWQSIEMQRRVIDESGNSVERLRLIKDMVQRDEGRMMGQPDAGQEERFYERVCKILDCDEDAINPIGQLMNKEEYEGMDDGNRQRYVLELSKKFREMRERYYRERMGKSC